MFEALRIILSGRQPAAKVSDKALERLIERDFGNKASEVKQKLLQVTGGTQKGKNRISAAILKLSNRDFNSIDHYIKLGNADFRDIISQAEYPRCSKSGFNDTEGQNMKRIYLEDWTEYSKWLKN